MERHRHSSSRVGDAARSERTAPECFIVPIDVCYELVGELRRVWRGFDGGSDAHDALRVFFDRVRSRAQRQTNA